MEHNSQRSAADGGGGQFRSVPPSLTIAVRNWRSVVTSSAISAKVTPALGSSRTWSARRGVPRNEHADSQSASVIACGLLELWISSEQPRIFANVGTSLCGTGVGSDFLFSSE